MMKILFRLIMLVIELVVFFPVCVLFIFVEKNKFVWVFGSRLGFKADASELYWQADLDPEIRAVWVRTSFERDEGEPGYYYLHPVAIFYQFISGVSVLSTGHGDLLRWSCSGKYVVQLWHGIPIKKILLNSMEFDIYGPVVALMAKFVIKRSSKNYDLVVCSGEKNKQCFVEAFGVGEEVVQDFGFPRHDRMVHVLAGLPRDKVILVAPTWHDIESIQRYVDRVLNPVFIEKSMLAGYNIELALHQKNISYIDSLNFDKRVLINSDDDKYASCNRYALLITDYSSLGLDFEEAGIPTYFVTHDYDEYKRKRGIYVQYESLYVDEQCSVADLTKRMMSRITSSKVKSEDKVISKCSSRKIMQYIKKAM